MNGRERKTADAGPHQSACCKQRAITKLSWRGFKNHRYLSISPRQLPLAHHLWCTSLERGSTQPIFSVNSLLCKVNQTIPQLNGATFYRWHLPKDWLLPPHTPTPAPPNIALRDRIHKKGPKTFALWTFAPQTLVPWRRRYIRFSPREDDDSIFDFRPVKTTTVYSTFAPWRRRRYIGLSPRVTCTRGAAFCFVFPGVTIFPVHREMVRVFVDNLCFKSGDRESHTDHELHGWYTERVTQIMNCTVDTRASTATRLQRAVWIGTIFRTCGRSREESITCGDQGMDVWGYGGDTQPNFEFAHLLNETRVDSRSFPTTQCRRRTKTQIKGGRHWLRLIKRKKKRKKRRFCVSSKKWAAGCETGLAYKMMWVPCLRQRQFCKVVAVPISPPY